MYFDSTGHFPVAIDKIFNGVDFSLELYKFILDQSIKRFKPEVISLDMAKKLQEKADIDNQREQFKELYIIQLMT